MNIRKFENAQARNVLPVGTTMCSTSYIGWEGGEIGADVEWMRKVFHDAAAVAGATVVGESIITGREIADADRAAGVETLVGVVMRIKKYLIQYAY